MKLGWSQDMMQNAFRAILWVGIGFLAGKTLLFIFSLPEKYSMTIAFGLIATPMIFLVRDKEKLLIGAFLFSLPVSMGFKLIEVTRAESTNSSVALLFQVYLCDILLILLAFIWLFKVFSTKYKSEHSIWQNKLIVPILLWIGMGIVSLIPAIDRTACAVEIVRMVRILLTFTIVFHYVKARKEIHFILKCLLLAYLFQAILMFAQYATNSLFISFPGEFMELDIAEQGLRPGGTMAHSSHFAKLSGLILPIALAYIFFAPRLREKVLSLIIWSCGSVALVLTISRAGLATWLVSSIGFFAGIIFLRIVSIRRMVPLFLTCILWVGIMGSILYLVGGQRLQSRGFYDSSAASRIPMWKVALNVIRSHPLMGVGLENYTLVYEDYDNTPEQISVEIPDCPVHSLFLLYAAEIGIPGLLFFLWFIWELVKGSIRCARRVDIPIEKALFLSLAIGAINLSLHSLTDPGVRHHLIHLSVIAIFAAYVARQRSIFNSFLGRSTTYST